MIGAQWKSILLGGMFFWATSQANAQDHNFGYYELIHLEGNLATYELVWSEYVPAVEYEPREPGDFHIPRESQGDWCDPVIGACSWYADTAEDRILPRIFVLDLTGRERTPTSISLWPAK